MDQRDVREIHTKGEIDRERWREKHLTFLTAIPIFVTCAVNVRHFSHSFSSSFLFGFFSLLSLSLSLSSSSLATPAVESDAVVVSRFLIICNRKNSRGTARITGTGEGREGGGPYTTGGRTVAARACFSLRSSSTRKSIVAPARHARARAPSLNALSLFRER